jgi:hypothetical protein
MNDSNEEHNANPNANKERTALESRSRGKAGRLEQSAYIDEGEKGSAKRRLLVVLVPTSPSRSDNARTPSLLLMTVAMLCSAHLPLLPPSHSSSSMNESRPKRRLSEAVQLDLEEEDEGAYDQDHDEDHQLRLGAGGRSKRSRISQGGGGGADGEHNTSPKQLQPGKALTEKEKESRRVARMIRNRSALTVLSFPPLPSPPPL